VSSDPLLPHVRLLLTERIDSVAQLDLLLFMHRRRERAWTPADASTELRISPDWTRAELEKLAARGLLLCEGQAFRYSAAPDLDSAVSDLSRAYQAFPVTVVGVIYSSKASVDPNLRQFADAFRLRRERRSSEGDKEPPRG